MGRLHEAGPIPWVGRDPDHAITFSGLCLHAASCFNFKPSPCDEDRYVGLPHQAAKSGRHNLEDLGESSLVLGISPRLLQRLCSQTGQPSGTPGGVSVPEALGTDRRVWKK